jgi:hypothetical protein
MTYMMLICETDADFAARTDEHRDAFWGAWRAYHQALVQAGVIVGGNALQPPATGATVRVRDGRRQVEDGPFADTKEQVGGFILLDVPSLEAALDWAARCPAAATGAVEVRPVLAM